MKDILHNNNELQKEDASVKVDDDNQSEKDSGMDDEPLAEISSEHAKPQDSDDDDLCVVKRRPRKMVINEDEGEHDSSEPEVDLHENDNDVLESPYISRVDATPPEKPPKKKKMLKTTNQVLEGVLKDSEDEDNIRDEHDVGDSDSNSGSSDSESARSHSSKVHSQAPSKYNSDLFDAEESSEDDRPEPKDYFNDIDNEKDDEGFEETLDPKLLKKLQKMKGAAKKPREQKSRKCKPSRNDLLGLHGETQRLVRESQINLPYHNPAPKSLQDFMDRAKKKQEVLCSLKGARDMEKALVIQEKLIEPVKFPQFHFPVKSQQEKQTSAISSQMSCPDSGHHSGMENKSQDSMIDESVNPRPNSPKIIQEDSSDEDDDDLPDLFLSNSDKLSGKQFPSQRQIEPDFKTHLQAPVNENEINSQQSTEPDSQIVEEFESQSGKETDSQKIEDVESLSLKDFDSQNDHELLDSISDPLEHPAGDKNVSISTKEAELIEKMKQSSNVIMKSLASTVHNSSAAEDIVNNGSKVELESTVSQSSCMNSDSLCKVNDDKNGNVAKEHCSVNARNGLYLEGKLQECSNNHVNTADSQELVPHSTSQTSCAQVDVEMSLQEAKQKAVEELESRGVVPKLGNGHADFIIFDDSNERKMNDDVNDPRKRGIKKFVDRILQQMQQSRKRTLPSSKNVEISIIEKEGGQGNREELTLKTVTYHVEEEQESEFKVTGCTPGSQLQVLKQKLEVGMQKRRFESYEKRRHLYELENEEGFDEEGDGELPEDEEEAELTDGTDTEEEEEEDDDDDDLVRADEKEKERNPFIDDEADEDEESADEKDSGEDGENSSEEAEPLHLKLESSDDEEIVSFKKPHARSQRLAISDDEDSKEPDDMNNISKSECENQKAAVEKSFDLDEMTPMTRLLRVTQPKKQSSLTLPIEDSQDLYGVSESDRQSSLTGHTLLDASFSEYGVSQMLDADGYLKVATLTSKPSLKALSLETSQMAEGTSMDELMGLCSGNFMEGALEKKNKRPVFKGLFEGNSHSQDDKESLTSLFDGSSQSQDDRVPTRETMSQSLEANMDELLGLCSGQFSSNTSMSVNQSQTMRGLKRRLDVSNADDAANDGCDDGHDDEMDTGPFKIPLNDKGEKETDDEIATGPFKIPSNDTGEKETDKDELGTDPFKIVSDDEETKDSSDDEIGVESYKIFSDGEDTKDTDKDELSRDDENDERPDREVSFKGFMEKGKLRREFIEEEAELSGSDVDSDENDDLAEEDDYLEMEEGDNDIDMNEDQLRDQVGRVHMKQMLDDDARELMRYKEMYLPDGDLHSEGAGRQRRFRWKDMDEESQKDMFEDVSDEENREDVDDKQWRVQRFEREKFLEEQQENDNESNSRLMKFGKIFIRKQVSEPLITGEQKTSNTNMQTQLSRSQSLIETTSPSKFLKPKIPKRGSFLMRSKQSLAQIAEMTKLSSLNMNGTRNSRNFVFQVISPDKKSDSSDVINPASESKVPVPKKPAVFQPAAKKQRIEPETKPKSQKSIFKLLENS